MTEFIVKYATIYVLLFLAGFSFVLSPKTVKTNKFNNQLIIFFSLLLFFLFASRSFHVGTDTLGYVSAFERGIFHPYDIGFRLFLELLHFFSSSRRFYLYVISLAFMLPICLFFYKVRYENKFIMFFIFVNLFSFVNMGINIIRQGIAVSIFLLAIYYFGKAKTRTVVLLFFLSFSFHYAMIVPIILYLISINFRSIMIPFLCFVLSIVLAIFAFDFLSFLKSIPILGSWSILVERIEVIAQAEGYRTGFRVDFFVFNLFFVVLGLISYRNAIKLIPQYRIYLSYFLFSSAYFFLMFWVPFSDRFGIFSWIFIPFVMLPFVQQIGLFSKIGRLFSLLAIVSIHILMLPRMSFF